MLRIAQHSFSAVDHPRVSGERQSGHGREALRLMVFLNPLWAMTDAVYIPLFALTAIELAVKLVVNTALAIGLAGAARHAPILP